jgi:hypothetical protein
MKSTIRLSVFFAVLLIVSAFTANYSLANPPAKQEFYEIKIYNVYGPQEAKVDAFLRDVYIPALHRAGIVKVGVFKPLETDLQSGKKIFVFIPYKTLEQYASLSEVLANDKTYQDAGKSFLAAPYNEPPYKRQETILLRAFKDWPQPTFPSYTNPVSERVYELRSYESSTEDLAIRKIHMFNEGKEIDIFTKLKFNAVFYGEVLAGASKPNLMYMTTFTDMQSHDEHWKAFGASDEWKALSPKEEYKNTVSYIDRYLLRPTNYSDF